VRPWILMNEEKLKKQTKDEENQQDAVDYEEKWKRALADYRNLQKRVTKEKQDLARFSNRALISKLLPVLDDLEEAVRKSEDQGYEKILNKFRGVLQEEGLEEIEVMGKEFDPRVMEGVFAGDEGKELSFKDRPAPPKRLGEGGSQSLALGNSSPNADGESAEKDKKVVNKVVRKGYNIKGELLRPARVIVGLED